MLQGSGGWLITLKTRTSQEGYDLAIELARKSIEKTGEDDSEHEVTEISAEAVALHFQTIAAANDYWT